MKRKLDSILSPLRYFINDSRAVGILLMVATVASLILANSDIGKGYRGFWINEIHGLHVLYLPLNLLEWINNFGMSFFFLMAGAEIKRELLDGELSTFKKAILPFGAAIGGMLFPSMLFIVFNVHSGYIEGWAIPAATDIAFSLGVVSLLGKRVPLGLKTFLIALAIIDDLGAIIVIAFFYGSTIQLLFLAAAILLYIILLLLNYFKVKVGFIHIFLSICLWYVLLRSGIEASIAGVLVAFAIPGHKLPAIEKSLHNCVNFFIIPFFVLANTAILFPGNIFHSIATPLGLGIITGLVIGKPLGIYLISRLLVAFNIAALPQNIKWKQVMGLGILAGIGFTMSFFITTLAFDKEEVRDVAKVAILASVVISVFAGLLYFYLTEKNERMN